MVIEASDNSIERTRVRCLLFLALLVIAGPVLAGFENPRIEPETIYANTEVFLAGEVTFPDTPTDPLTYFVEVDGNTITLRTSGNQAITPGLITVQYPLGKFSEGEYVLNYEFRSFGDVVDIQGTLGFEVQPYRIPTLGAYSLVFLGLLLLGIAKLIIGRRNLTRVANAASGEN